MPDFTTGQQPCQDYTPMMTGNGYAEWANVHECFCGHAKGQDCSGTVSFCENCHRDHHSNGYETCVCGGKGFQ